MFDKLSRQPAKRANKSFTGQNLKNDMTLLHADPQLTESGKKVWKMLKERESVWNDEQKRLKSMKDTKKYQKAQNTYAYQNRVLAACKTWGGPCQSVAELNALLLQADNKVICFTQEITYYKLTHMSKFLANRQLFRVRGITYEEKLENLTNILSSDHEMLQTLQPTENTTAADPPAMQNPIELQPFETLLIVLFL